jgi:GMP synthase-like glutamine amidotransferase
MRALFIQQDHVSPVGHIGSAFAERGFDVEPMLVVPEERFAQPDVTVTFPDPASYDVIVPMGAPWSVYDHGTIGTWVGDEVSFLRAAHDEGVPIFAICFGGQALATALGGHVESAPTAELGWTNIETDDEQLIGPGPWFQFHYDRWALPPGAREIARTESASQAFVLGRSLAVQFHPELTSATLQGWNDNGGRDLLLAHGIEPDELLARTAAQDDAAGRRAAQLVDGFLTRVATAEFAR